MATAVSTQNNKVPARPLKVLVPMIREELEAGDKAGLSHYRRAGELLLEAKEQVAHGEWKEWLEKNFNRKYSQAHAYMELAKEKQKFGAPNFSNLSEFTHPNRDTNHRELWHEPVKESINRVNVDRLTQERQSREKEEKIIEEMARRIIDIGYRALAAKFHPDRGGSTEAMARLTKARDLLKNAI